MRHGKSHGFSIAGKAKGLYHHNTIEDNEKVGLMIIDSAKPLCSYNLINAGQSHGLVLDDSAAGVFTCNALQQNAGEPLLILTSGLPVFQGPLSSEQMLAVCMAAHHRLGRDSPLRALLISGSSSSREDALLRKVLSCCSMAVTYKEAISLAQDEVLLRVVGRSGLPIEDAPCQ